MNENIAFSQRVMPHSRKLFAVAFRFLQRAEEAEDVVQDIIERLWQQREQLPSGEQLLPFMLTITRHLCIDRLRSRRETGELEDEADFDNRIEQRDQVRQLLLLIDRLPPDQQRVLKLRAFDDLPTEEIATLLHLRTDNVRQLLSRARRHLKELSQKAGVL